LVLQLLIFVTLAGLPGDTPDAKSFVSAVNTPHATVAAGKPATVELKFRVNEGFHINSNVPRSSYLIPTKLTLSPPTDVGVGKITYPAGTDIVLPFAPDEKLNVYSGEFAITANVSSLHTATPGHYRMHGELSYQACNDRAWYPPKKLPVAVGVTVLKSRIAANGGKTSNLPQSPHP
jgi:hypothetical protein